MVKHRDDIAPLTCYTAGCREEQCRAAWRQYNRDRRDRLNPNRKKRPERQPVGEIALDPDFWLKVNTLQRERLEI